MKTAHPHSNSPNGRFLDSSLMLNPKTVSKSVIAQTFYIQFAKYYGNAAFINKNRFPRILRGFHSLSQGKGVLAGLGYIH